MQFTIKSETPLAAAEVRPLSDAEINQVDGGVLWLVPTVMVIAVSTYLASQKH